MSFISYSLQYYREELQKLEAAELHRSEGTNLCKEEHADRRSSGKKQRDIYRAKQLLKILDDLVDEGYTELSEKMEQDCQGVTRLREYLKRNGAIPFQIQKKIVKETDVTYEPEQLELEAALEAAVKAATRDADAAVLQGTVCGEASEESAEQIAFINRLADFCDWIGSEEDTAYIFLLRDTLLPYVYYKAQRQGGFYPWLLGRKAVDAIVGKQWVDDEIRAAVIRALESGKGRNFQEFCETVLPDIRETVSHYASLEKVLQKLLETVKEKRIVVVESGCSGTFPLLLMSMDERVDMRMYTTYPYLLDAYGDKVYTERYEDIRLFETMYSQDLYFRFADLRAGRFYVNRCDNKRVEEKAFAELRRMQDAAQGRRERPDEAERMK